MAQSFVISRTPPEQKSQDYAFLRKQAMEEVIRKLAADSWTDHNIHDPGITLLEALCFATTEAGLRVGMDMQDIVTTAALRRDPEFQTARRILPSAPVFRDDIRKVLIDHPDVRNAWVFPLSAEPSGRHRILLEFEDTDLNSNIYPVSVAPAALTDTYDADIAFPHWDDEDVLQLREDVVIVNIVFDGAPSSIWNSIEGSTAFFGRASVTVQPQVGPQQVLQLWVVAQIVSPMSDPILEAPLILDEVVTLTTATGDNSPADQTLMKQLNRRVTSANDVMRIIRRYLRGYRNLCEDFGELSAVRLQEIAVGGILEVGSGVNIEVLLSEIFLRIDELISERIVFHPIHDIIDETQGGDSVFEGPPLDHGILSESSENAGIPAVIFTSDILRIIYQLRNAEHSDVVRREEITLRNIIAVRNLALSNYLDNRPITTNARDCLRLVQSQRHIPVLSVQKSHLVIYRNGIEIQYDQNRVLDLYSEGKSAFSDSGVPLAADIEIPASEAYPIEAYYPVQYDLPMTYGVSAAGLPEQATTTRKAQARQLKGYLLHFEHLIAGVHAQMADFNTFFGADTDIEHTLVQQPLYHIMDMDQMLTSFNPATDDWQAFQADEANPYAAILRTGLEERERFLEKRNAVLNHLLAIQGEEMQERTSLLLRLSGQVPNAASMSVQALLDAQYARRLQALEDIIEDKSAYYLAMPELNRDKYQAFGNPLWRSSQILEITQTAVGFQWMIRGDQGDFFRSTGTAPASRVEARPQAEEVARLATDRSRYTIRIEAGGQRRLEVRRSPATAPVGESVATFNTNPQAQGGILAAEAHFRDLWIRLALSPYECRLYHLLGIDVKERRQIIRDASTLIEIFDEVDADLIIEKRFRVWEQAGFAGNIIIESIGNYPGATDPIAMANARAAVRDLVRLGTNVHQYQSIDAGGGTFRVVLVLEDGTPFAQSPSVFNSEPDARQQIRRIRALIYEMFGCEGLYCIEHPMLYAEAPNPALETVEVKDAYSFQMTIVIPSGYMRDFSVANDPLQETQPDLYRSIEFRKYAEQQMRRHCPAHILVRVLWSHRAVPGTPVALNDPCFENFENAYRSWCAEVVSDEPVTAVLMPLRNRLVEVINTLYQAYYID